MVAEFAADGQRPHAVVAHVGERHRRAAVASSWQTAQKKPRRCETPRLRDLGVEEAACHSLLAWFLISIKSHLLLLAACALQRPVVRRSPGGDFSQPGVVNAASVSSRTMPNAVPTRNTMT